MSSFTLDRKQCKCTSRTYYEWIYWMNAQAQLINSNIIYSGVLVMTGVLTFLILLATEKVCVKVGKCYLSNKSDTKFFILSFWHTFAILSEKHFALTETKGLKMSLLLLHRQSIQKDMPLSPPPKKDSCPKNMNKPPSARLHYIQLLRALQKHLYKKGCCEHGFWSPDH